MGLWVDPTRPNSVVCIHVYLLEILYNNMLCSTGIMVPLMYYQYVHVCLVWNESCKALWYYHQVPQLLLM